MKVLGDVLAEGVEAEVPRGQADDEGSVESEGGLFPELDPEPPRDAFLRHRSEGRRLRDRRHCDRRRWR